MFYIHKEFTIDSAHYLEGHNGKCKTMHGHTYRIEVVVRSKILDEMGMVVDFGVIKSLLNDQYDHRCLNDFSHFNVDEGGVRPTAENMAKRFWEEIQEYCSSLPHLPRCVSVKIWETPTSWAIYQPQG